MTFTQKKLKKFREKYVSKLGFSQHFCCDAKEFESFLTTAIQEAQAEERKRILEIIKEKCFCTGGRDAVSELSQQKEV